MTATLQDAFTNPVPGEPVTIFIQAFADGQLANNPARATTEITPTSRWGFTDASGQISVFYHAPSTSDLSDAVDAFTSSIPATSVTDAVYTMTASGATDLRITFIPSDTAQAGSTFEFVVEAVDGPGSTGNVDTGNTALVDISAEVGSGILCSENPDMSSPLTQVTLATGTKTVYGQGDNVGDWDITADDNAAFLGSDTEQIVIQDQGIIDHYEVVTVPTVTAGQPFSVVVTAKDQFNNTVTTAGNSVDLVAVDATTLTPETVLLIVGQTNLIDGQAIESETYELAKDIKVRARDASSNEGFSQTLSVTAAVAYQLQKMSGDTTGVYAGFEQDLVSTVLDAFDNPVSGEEVTFVVSEGGGELTPASVFSDPNGQVTTAFTTGPIVGNNRVKATILGGLLAREKV
ncbi:MAG: Ig-like domain-containing protein, partial [Candidatus Krumholzibacteria bacterium]|nr:Ig-like domain-containing protein [Candidatus Krumholzibacteria bacterium]